MKKQTSSYAAENATSLSGKATPGPWTTRKRIGGEIVIIPTDHERMPDSWIIAECRYQANDEANAAFIVRACNSHAAMLEALKGCERVTKAWLADMKDYPLVNPEKAAATMELIRIQEAIRLAEGRG